VNSVVAIIGAGDLGGALAHRLATRDQVAEIRLIDDAGTIAAGKALDIQQAAPVDGFRTSVTAGEGLSAANADIVILADTAGTRPAQEWKDEAGLTLLKRVAAQSDRAIIICAGASQRPLIERGAAEAGIARKRLIGSAPIAWAAAVRSRLALELDVSPQDVSLLVLGRPPDRALVPWSAASVGGLSVVDLLTPPALRRMDALSRSLWPPGPYALASAAAKAVEAITTGTRPALSCFAVLDGQLGVRHGVAAVPVMLGSLGVDRVVEPTLSVQERVRLMNALAGSEL
jgi:malate dehydrogenase